MKDKRRILIIEAKKADSRDQMEKVCSKALEQITDREYAKGLDDYHVYCCGIAIYQKNAMVKML